jgi:hypothetical protein
MTPVTKHELRQKLLNAVAELYQLQTVLEHAIRAGVPPDAYHVVQLDAVAKQLCDVLKRLDTSEADRLQESA